MKYLLIIFFCLCFQIVTASTQEITISLKDAKLEAVFKEIQKQTDYRFVYTKEQLENSKKVTLEVKRAQLETVLQLCFKEQPLTYTVEEKFIVIAVKEKSTDHENVIELIDLAGKVINEQGQVLVGASISIRGTNRGTATDAAGEFFLKGIDPDAVLLISSIGYEAQVIRLQGQTVITVQLKMTVVSLDESVVVAYGTTTKRLNTGSIGKVSGSEISKQPVTNPLAALEGRIPGLIVTQSSGIPGGSFKMQIRGQNSLAQGNDALIIIDGVPFAPNNSKVNQVFGAFSFNNNGLSPLNSINPNDIESIEVLKDADATAIYGSRGANGVILITTKKGKAGKTKINLNAYTGWGRITRSMDMLNTQQYLEMRREAFRNDGVAPTNSNAYDLLLWDTTRYTDFKKILIGGTARISDAQLSISGGTVDTKFLIGGGYHHESTVYPGDHGDKKGSFHFNVNHTTLKNKLSIILTGSYWSEVNTIMTNDVTSYITSIPNLPELYDSAGRLNWSAKGFSFTNPLSFLLQQYKANVNNLLGNLQINYRLNDHLLFKVNTGYNYFDVDELRVNPIAAQDPATSPTGSSAFGNTRYKSVIIEPQAEYTHAIGKGNLSLLTGFTWHQNIFDTKSTNASGYTNDALLKSLGSASSITATSSNSQYRYAAVFGRVNYNLANKYLINVTGRRDGSSRFGPGKRYANFAAIGCAWIFSQEDFFKRIASFLSYGKLRASYGTSGNDAIGDYQYLDTWSATNLPYQGNSGLSPTGLFNEDYSWEINKKLEASIDLGFINDRILISASFFRNRSSNQIVSYSLPSQTGFNSITKNFPALVQNTGFEGELSFVPFKSKKFTWLSAFTITAPKNKLVRFDGLATSSYRTRYLIGRPLNILSGFQVVGVDPATGVYQFLGNDGVIKSLPNTSTDVKVGLLDLDPKFYGGLKNSFSYKSLQLDFFLEYRKQIGGSYLAGVSAVPGTRFNQPAIVLNRWQKAGQQTNFEAFTQTTANPAYLPVVFINAFGSNIQYSDASFIRLKNLSVSYTLPESSIRKLKVDNLRVYLQGQNLFVITKYRGSDPETQNLSRLPPLKFFTGGIQFIF